MKQYIRLLTVNSLIVAIFILAACSSPTKNQHEDEKTAVADSSNMRNCKREAAKSIVKKTVYPNSVFQLQPDHLTGLETVRFDNGDQLIIHNYGCENYILTFRFETSRFQNDTANIPFWYKRAVSLLSEILPALDAPIDITKGINRIVAQIENEVPNGFKGLKLREQLDVADSLTKEHVTIDNVLQLTDKKFAVEITFVKERL